MKEKKREFMEEVEREGGWDSLIVQIMWEVPS